MTDRSHRSHGPRARGATVAAALAAAVVALAAPAELAAQDRFADAEIGTEHVAGPVYMLTGPGGNIGASVGEDGTLIVDDKYAPLSGKIRAALREIGSDSVRFVLNTHCHGDHTGGNEAFGETAPIIAHSRVRSRLAEARLPCGGSEPDYPEVALPVITFGDSVSVHFNGEEIRAIHQPHAHTDGDAVVWFTGSNVVHMGDLFFNERFPFIDHGSGGSVAGTVEGVREVLSQVPSDAAVIPGHGPLTDVSGLREYLEMLRETRSWVQERMSQGMGLEEIQEEGVPSEWEGWAWEFISADRWIETLYRELSG